MPFGGVTGLRDISFRVDPGERVSLLGPSGEGKTSLLRAIAGLAPLAAGQVFVDGADVTSRPRRRAASSIATRSRCSFPHLTVWENVAFPLTVRGMKGSAVEARVGDLLERVGLASLASRGVAGLSGGQAHRVALARALAARPQVLLLDEPFAALDPSLRADVRDAVLELLGKEAPAVILVTHDVDEAAAFSHRILVLLGRAMVQDAPPHDLLRAPVSLEVARFLGIPNLIEGRVDGQGHFICGAGRCRWEGSAGDAVLVARPDGVRASLDAAGPCRVSALQERVGRHARDTARAGRTDPCDAGAWGAW